MNLDFDLYRQTVQVSSNPLVRLSVIDISPDHPQRTFVFIHGFGGKASQWRYQLQSFSVENRVIALDLRGHGLSDRPASGYDLETMLKDIETALESLGVDRSFVLVGHSFGGALVAEYALRHPDRLEALILVATAARFRFNWLYRLGLYLPDWMLHIAERFTRQWLSAPPYVLKPFYRQSVVKWSGYDVFPKLQVPTLVLRGHRDLVFERPLFEEVVHLIPGAQEADIGASGHMLMLERHEAVRRAIERFLAGEQQRYWREEGKSLPGKGREALRRERPWLVHYEDGVPYTIAIPSIPLPALLESAVRRFPHHPAIHFRGHTWTYQQLDREVNRFANALLGMGLGKGARVGILLPNIPQAVIAFYGTLRAGCVAVFVPPLTDPEESFRQLEEAETGVVVMLNLWIGMARQLLSSGIVPHLILTDAADLLPAPKRWLALWQHRGLKLEGALNYRRWIDGQSTLAPSVTVTPEDMAVIQYTGGTTAQARGVVLSHRNLVANALQTRHWMPNAQEGKERFLCVLPFSHSYGLTTALNTPIALGAALILEPQFQVQHILESIRRHRPTIFPGVPSMYTAINATRGARRYGISSIKVCISGSAPLPVEVQEAFEKLTRGRLIEGYGLTEASPVTHANPLNGLRKAGSIGIPLPSTEARLVDLRKGQREVRRGQIGELAVRGPQVMLGYWKNPQETARVLGEDGWLLTGDIAQMDEDGYFRIIARKADMWYPGNLRRPVFPRDVEEVLYEIPQIKEAVVVAVAGQAIAFVITSTDRPNSEAILGYCQRRLPPELVPRAVFFVDDFPRTFIGKVLRRELIKRYEQSLERSSS